MQSKYTLRPEVIDRARENLGEPSDEKLAARLGVTVTTISRIRNGSSPRFTLGIKLLEAARVSYRAGVISSPSGAPGVSSVEEVA